MSSKMTTCICGCEVQARGLKIHMESKKHLKIMNPEMPEPEDAPKRGRPPLPPELKKRRPPATRPVGRPRLPPELKKPKAKPPPKEPSGKKIGRPLKVPGTHVKPNYGDDPEGYQKHLEKCRDYYYRNKTTRQRRAKLTKMKNILGNLGTEQKVIDVVLDMVTYHVNRDEDVPKDDLKKFTSLVKGRFQAVKDLTGCETWIKPSRELWWLPEDGEGNGVGEGEA